MKIRDLLPLRTVINEMCRYQLSYKCPELKTFDDFFDHIENDTFQRLHYTTNSKQFYQERFVDEATDSKAIIFANCEVIRQLSDSKLMYVDSSFKIDSNDTFDYQLVTVLVWMDDSVRGTLLVFSHFMSYSIFLIQILYCFSITLFFSP